MAKPISLIRDTRPMPPADLRADSFAPSDALARWILRTFVAETGPLHNPHHLHLAQAEICCLWTTVPNDRAGRTILATTELGAPQAFGKWQKARAVQQIEEWFGIVPDFIITVSAPWWQWADDASACALAEHELYHAAQAIDEYGMPKFNRQSGLPVYAIRGHDVEEFVGVVERYGAEATRVQEMVRAANAGPTVAHAKIAMACGVCNGRRRA